MTKKDVAIIGGTFDPIHNGHTEMARYLADNYLVDEVWMLPTYNPPFKDINKVCDYHHRVEMTKLAVSDIKNVSVNSFEEEYYYNMLNNTTMNNCYNSDIKTYTSEILKDLEKRYLNVRFHFVCGFDAIKSITLWHDYKYLIKNFWFYIFDRDDDEFKTIKQKKFYLDNIGKKKNINFYYELFDYKIPDISSTKIRELLKDKRKNQVEILKYINVNVYNYIIKNNLY